MLRLPKLPLQRPAGFSLVEIMVGLAIGMLAVIVILQVFALSEGRKRTTTGGGDAQSNGAVMLYRLQHDIAQAGYGMTSIRLFNCSATWVVASGATITTPVPLAPVTINPAVGIIPAGDPNTDRLLVMYGSGNGQPEGNVISAQASGVYTVQMPNSFTPGVAGVGDQVIASPSPCGTLILDRITAVGANNVTVATGIAGAADAPLYNLGPTPTVRAYAIRSGNLTVCDYMLNDCGVAANTSNSSIWVPIGSNIVSMKAVYGRDDIATGSPVSTDIQNANVNIWDLTQPTTACLWTRVAAVNLVLVARSSQFEKELVTTTAINVGSPVNAPTWAQNAVAPIVPSLGPDTAIDEPWKHYRYKVLQTVAPIRNVAWMGVPTGC